MQDAKKNSSRRLWSITIGVLIALFSAPVDAVDYGDTTKFYQKEIRLKVSKDIVSMPEGYRSLSFDTSECIGCKDIYPSWRFVGDLLIADLQTTDSSLDVTDSTNLVGVDVGSTEFADALSEIGAIKVQRRAPQSPVGEVDYWDDVRKKWWVLPDMSLHYRISWTSDLSTDSVLAIFGAIDSIQNLDAVEIPQLSSLSCDNGKPPYIPNGLPSDTVMYHLYESVPGTDWIGTNTVCGWNVFGAGERGAGVTIALLDVPPDSSHEDLDVSVYGTPWSPGVVDHGTAAAGTIGAIDDNGIGVAGIAPDARILVFNRPGVTFEEQLLEAADSADVVYIGGAYDHQDLYTYEACSTAFAKNCVIVTPAGNLGSPYADPYESRPAMYDQFVIAVGFTTRNGTLHPQSNYACDTCDSWVDVVTSGSRIWTTYSSNEYHEYTGSSAAAAIVTGMVALARSYDPLVTPEVIENALESSADTSVFDTAYNVRSHGAGFATTSAFLAEFPVGAENSKRQPANAIVQAIGDTVRYLIVTNDSLTAAFDEFRQLKHRRGYSATLVTTESIDTTYSGVDLAEKIRSCIKDFHDNYHLEYVLLGGDQSIIPIRYAYNNLRGPGVLAPSDFYYACLDGSWNDDADTLYGEMDDDVDLSPEVAVGRLPFSDANDITTYINKYRLYELPTQLDWIDRVVGIGSALYADGDGPALTQAVLDQFPGGFSIARLYDDSSGVADREAYFDSMNVGQGIVMSYTQAHTHGGNFFIRRESSAQLIHWDDVDTLSNDSMPSLVFAATCFNNNIDSNCIAEHYIGHDFGGAIAYIGSSYNDFSFKTVDLAKDFFNRLFDGSRHEVGSILNLAREVHYSKAINFDGSDRHTMFTYALLGDPALDVWTATPDSLSVSAPDWLAWGLGNQSFDVTVSSGGNPVESVLVCVSEGSNIYETAYTNSSGIATFSTVSVPDSSEGDVFISVSKHNFIPVDTSMQYTHCGLPGDMTDDCNVDISDVTFLTNWLFVTFVPPSVPNRGDVNASCAADVSDLTLLINHLFPEAPYTSEDWPLWPGCVTTPVGGKQSGTESAEVDPSITLDHVTVNGNVSLSLGTERVLQALSLELTVPESVEWLPTLSAGLDTTLSLYAGRKDDTTIALSIIDPYNRGRLRIGEYAILDLPEQVVIKSAMVVDIAPGGVARAAIPTIGTSEIQNLPTEYSLSQNYPNPFNPSTTIPFALPKSSEVQLEVINVLGQRVIELINGVLPAGEHRVVWDGTDTEGTRLASGVYFYRLTTDDFESSKKMLLLK